MMGNSPAIQLSRADKLTFKANELMRDGRILEAKALIAKANSLRGI